MQGEPKQGQEAGQAAEKVVFGHVGGEGGYSLEALQEEGFIEDRCGGCVQVGRGRLYWGFGPAPRNTVNEGSVCPIIIVVVAHFLF